MDQSTKDSIYRQSSQHVAEVMKAMEHGLQALRLQIKKIQANLSQVGADDKIVQERLLDMNMLREQEIESLIPSPYFVRCLVSFQDGEKEELYFGKFSYPDEKIYSWVSPAAALRFKEPGAISYERPNGEYRNGILYQKEQFMIQQGDIVYLTTESIDAPRALVYQSYFSQQKKGFVLPEIVAQMEAAQDAVIRANFRGPLLISGPAGSGKTTLALHRVAYLAQSPDIADKFKPKDIIVFVQDEGTQSYFSHLLPELGIRGVTITTFAAWAMRVLEITAMTYVYRYGSSEYERDMFEFKKRQAVSNISKRIVYNASCIEDMLQEVYQPYFSESESELLTQQFRDKLLDRFDLTILLVLFKQTHGQLSMMQEYYEMKKNRSAQKKVGRFRVSYSLIIFDEFQNYISEQLKVIKSTLDETTSAVMYVGDIAQQTQIGTVQHWADMSESIASDRRITLQKVYRNTREILEYIQLLGYTVQISDQLKSGPKVIEQVCTLDEEILYIQKLRETKKGSIGVLYYDPSYGAPVLAAYSNIPEIHIMSMYEAQGVEFDVVCIVGIHSNMFDMSFDIEAYTEEKKRVTKDILYVALTRAIQELHVLGRNTLSTVV